MKYGKLYMIAAAAAVSLLLGGALVLTFAGPYLPVAQAAGTPESAFATPTAGAGLRTLTTGTPAPVEAAPTEETEPVSSPTSSAVNPAPTAPAQVATAAAPTVVATTVLTSPGTFTEVPGPNAALRTITVIGEGRVNVEPDTANANVGVEVVTSTVKAATAQATTLMNAVLKALKDQGIADSDIQTSGFNIYAERNFTTADGKPSSADQVRYHVSNNASVTIHDLDKVGSVLNAAIEAGANNIYGVTFSVADPTRAESQAYNAAMADALRRAKYLAGLAGVQIGPVSSVSEVVGRQVIVPSRDTTSSYGMGGGGGGAIQSGQLAVARQLEVVYYIR